MPNLGNVLKQEIARIARRELRSHVTAARKASAQHRHHIATLRRHIAVLEKKLAALASKSSPTPAVETGESPEARMRFAPKGLRSLRERLGLSADRFGKLIGVSGQSIYNWEHRIATPRARQLLAIAAVRSIGKREAMARLEALDAAPARKEVAGRRKPARSEKH